MARLKDREKALALRKQEMSYSQIKKILGVSKSTLSYWLRGYPLSKQSIKKLQRLGARRSEQAIEKYRETMRQKREDRLKQFYKKQRRSIFPLTKRESLLAGLFLYWGEGSKRRLTELAISNTDPSVIKFFITWLTKSLKIPKEKVKIQLHLYTDMDIKKEIQFWSKTLDMPFNQFTKPYIKKTSSLRINHKGGFGHGTCKIRVGGGELAEKMHMAIKAIADKYNKMGT